MNVNCGKAEAMTEHLSQNIPVYGAESVLQYRVSQTKLLLFDWRKGQNEMISELSESTATLIKLQLEFTYLAFESPQSNTGDTSL